MKRLLLVLISFAYVISTWADNILSLSTSDGNNGDEITVSAALSLSSDVSAAEISINLGAQLKYIDGSCEFFSDRLEDHTTSVNVDGDTLKVYIYSLSLTAIKKGDGELFSFKLKCGDEPGHYSVTPILLLSDFAGCEVASSARPVSMTICAGKVSVPNKVDFPKAFIGTENVATLTIRNIGNRMLTVSNIIPSCDWIKVSQTQFSIEAGSSCDVNVIVTPLAKGNMQEALTIVSDAGNDEVTVPVTVNAMKKNQIVVDELVTSTGGQAVALAVTLENQEEVTAIEFSIDVPDGFEIVPNSSVTTARTEGFSTYVTQKDNTCKLYLFSPSNKVIEDSSGKIVSFYLKPNVRSDNYVIKINDIKILNLEGENIASENKCEVQIGVKSPELYIGVGENENIKLDYVPVGEEQDCMLEIYNKGNSDLIIYSIYSDDECCYVKDKFPIYISPGADYKFCLFVKCDKVGDFITSLTVLSNNPTQPEYKTTISSKIIDVNTLALSGELQNGDKNFCMNVGLNNTAEIAAVQMDIHCPKSVNVDASDLKLSDRLSNTHQFSLTQMKKGEYRVVIYSMNNTCISGNTGALFALNFENNTDGTIRQSDFSIDNVFIGNKEGQNVCSIESYGFYNVYYETFSDLFKNNIVHIEVETIGTGTILGYHEEWVGEPLIMGESNIYAYQWTDHPGEMCHVTFYDEDNTTILTSTNVPSNYTMKLPTPPLKMGKVFYGWVVGDSVISNGVGTFCVQSDVQLYAVYTDKVRISESEITLVKGQRTSLRVLYGDIDAEVTNIIWTSSDVNIVTVSESGVVKGVKTGSAIITAEIPGTGLSCACNITVISDLFTLTYVVDGEVYSESTVEFGASITAIDAPTKEGHAFSGWSEIPETMPANDVTITGSFTVNSYTITYMYAGEVVNEVSLEYGAQIPTYEYAPEDDERYTYIFVGWFVDGSEFTETTMPARDMILEAKVDVADDINSVLANSSVFNIYTSTGTCLMVGASKEKLRSLSFGIYIINGKKISVRR